VEVLAGAAAVYVVRNLRRADGRADAEVNQAIEAGMVAVHDLVGTVLKDDTELRALEVSAPCENERKEEAVAFGLNEKIAVSRAEPVPNGTARRDGPGGARVGRGRVRLGMALTEQPHSP
jgi:hypothetical protein